MKCCIAQTPPFPAQTCAAPESPIMSPQLTLSSLFCVLALAGLCVVTSARDLAGIDGPVAERQAEVAPGLLNG